MNSLFREVILPAAASVGLLIVVGTSAVEAEDAEATVASTETVTMLTAAPSTALAIDQPGSDSGVATEATRRSSKERGSQRCERVERIGKFTVRRCE